MYADDTQIYLTFDINQPGTAVQKLDTCLSDIKSLMITNKLKINDDKTVILIIKTPEHTCIIRGVCKIQTCKPAMLVKHMNMETQCTSICKYTCYHLRNIGAIRTVLTESSST